MRLRVWLCVLSVLSVTLGVQAQTDGEPQVRVSLLTCSPGQEVYQLYGHTALRVVDEAQGLDAVFNYGVFDFHTPHFVWRFVLGQTDYMVAAYPFEMFLKEYRDRGSSVTEQVLDLTSEEAVRLVGNLIDNAMPEHRTYRYNFLLNNCTTRARDMVEQAVDGRIVYQPMLGEGTTYRNELHTYTRNHPWAEVGNDLLLGATADTLLDVRAEQFLPASLLMQFSNAEIYDTLDNRRPLLAATHTILEGREQPHEEPFPLPPLYTGLIVLACYVLVMGLEYCTRRMFWGVDILTMALQGLAGILLCFMLLFSHHPTVSSNWQVWVLNPLPLLCIPRVVRCAVGRRRCAYHYANLLWLALFVVAMPWMPQHFSALTLPLALTLFTRPVSYLLNYNRR